MSVATAGSDEALSMPSVADASACVNSSEAAQLFVRDVRGVAGAAAVPARVVQDAGFRSPVEQQPRDRLDSPPARVGANVS